MNRISMDRRSRSLDAAAAAERGVPVSVVADERLTHVAPDRRSAEFYRLAFAQDAGEGRSGVAVLDGLTGRQAEPILERAVRTLEADALRLADKYGSVFPSDYRSPYAALESLRVLERTARLFPDAVWTIEETRP